MTQMPMIHTSNDPCDQMVTIRQAVNEAFRCSLIRDKYTFVATILDVDRDEAKRIVYQYLYSGWYGPRI